MNFRKIFQFPAKQMERLTMGDVYFPDRQPDSFFQILTELPCF